MSNIIKQYYTAIAETLFKNTYEAMCAKAEIDNDELKKLCFDITFNRGGREIITDINETFYEMLDKIEAEIEPEPAEERKSFSDFYKNEGVINMQIDVTDYINETATAETVIANIEKALLKKVSYKRIAELFYYKRNHRWYDKGLEVAFREIVSHTIRNYSSGKFITRRNDKEIRATTRKLTGYLQKKYYSDLFENPELLEKYKLSKAEFYEEMNNTPIYAYAATNQGLEEEFREYKRTSYTTFDNTLFMSLKECLDEFVKEYKDTKFLRRPYERYFKESILPIAGFDFNKYGNYHNLKQKFILKKLYKNLNSCIYKLKKKDNAKNNTYRTYYLEEAGSSRFKEMEKKEDLLDMGKIIEVACQIIVSRKRQQPKLEDLLINFEEVAFIYKARTLKVSIIKK